MQSPTARGANYRARALKPEHRATATCFSLFVFACLALACFLPLFCREPGHLLTGLLWLNSDLDPVLVGRDHLEKRITDLERNRVALLVRHRQHILPLPALPESPYTYPISK